MAAKLLTWFNYAFKPTKYDKEVIRSEELAHTHGYFSVLQMQLEHLQHA